jgi:site-specific recombinase XerD
MPNSNVPQRISQKPKPTSLEIWLRDFLIDVQAANRTQGTIEYYRSKLTPFLAFLTTLDVTEPENLDAPHIRAFLVHLAQDRGAGGVHAYWRAVRAFVRFLVREEALDRNPLNRIRSPKLDEEVLEPVPTETVRALLATCAKRDIDLRDKAILLVLLDTGLRSGELLNLDIAHVDLNTGATQVHKSKNRKPRTVFIGRRTRKAVARYLRTRKGYDMIDPLWIAYRTDGDRIRLTYSGLREMVKRRAKKAGVESPTLHSFRRAFAITMLRNGADLITLGRLMGHGSLPVLTRYLKQITDDLGEAHAKYSPSDTLL